MWKCNYMGTNISESLINMVYDNGAVDNPNRKSVMDEVIHRGINIKESLAYLACAYAFLYSGAKTRKEAIIMFERYMENPVKAQNFSISQVYLDLGKSYESEYDFIKAEFCYIHHEAAFQDIAKSRGFESSPNVYLGRLFLKIGTQKAIDY